MCPKNMKKNANKDQDAIFRQRFSTIRMSASFRVANTLVILFNWLTLEAKSPLRLFLMDCILFSTSSILSGIRSVKVSFNLLAMVGDFPLVEIAILRLPFLTIELK